MYDIASIVSNFASSFRETCSRAVSNSAPVRKAVSERGYGEEAMNRSCKNRWFVEVAFHSSLGVDFDRHGPCI